MKIIDTDNFGRDDPDEKVIATGITYKPFGECMVSALNDNFSGETAPRSFKLVDDDYILSPGFRP